MIMPTKKKTVLNTVKSAARKTAAKAKPTLKTAATEAKKRVRPLAGKVSAKAKVARKDAGGFIQSVKDGIHSAMETAGDFMKKVTPDVLLPNSAKSRSLRNKVARQ